jgi:hypothetical protein
VVILKNQSSEIRRVALNKAHSLHPKPSWYGESVGHYENGDTLVIDTIGMNDSTHVDLFRTPHTTALHVIERWKLSCRRQGDRFARARRGSRRVQSAVRSDKHYTKVETPGWRSPARKIPSAGLPGARSDPASRQPDF